MKMIVQTTTQPVDMGSFGLALIRAISVNFRPRRQRCVLKWSACEELLQTAICLFWMPNRHSAGIRGLTMPQPLSRVAPKASYRT